MAKAVSGYLNLFINRNWMAKVVLSAALDSLYGHANKLETSVVEYCSPNTNKPLHLGHLRNMAIGESICRLLEFMGNKRSTETCVFQ